MLGVGSGGLESVEESVGAAEIHLVGEDRVEDLLERHLNAVGVFEEWELKYRAVGIGTMGLAFGLGAPDFVEVAVDSIAECGRAAADSVRPGVIAAVGAMGGRDIGGWGPDS